MTLPIASFASFERVFALGELPGQLAAALGRRLEPLPCSAPLPDPVPVQLLISLTAAARGDDRCTLLLTSLAIAAPHTPELFGYSDRRRRVAIVSTACLGFDSPAGTPAGLAAGAAPLADAAARGAARLANVIAHEGGHLDGLRHCRTPGCLMEVVRSVDALDRRGDESCGRCPRAGAGTRRAAAAGALLVAGALSFAVLDSLARTLAPGPQRPFACAPAAGFDGPRLFFKDRMVIEGTGGGAQPVACRAAAADALNRLFQPVEPPPALRVLPGEGGGALVLAGETVLLDVGGADASALARRRAGELEELLRAKGWPNDGCPECHAERPADLRNAFRARRGG